jgi:2-iminobutanoate/2-iminopropanoate deaminase
MIDEIHAEDAAPPGGHYSHAVRANGFVFISGVLPVPATGLKEALSSFDEQTEIVFENLDAILRAAGCERSDVAKVTVYVVGVEHWPTFDARYATFFGNARPARAVVPVPELHHGFSVEVELTAIDIRRHEGQST